jgi:hypothetical protein
MIEASCHCGAVRVQAPRPPETVTDCNCSICRRLGVLWAYHDPAEVVMETPDSALTAYVRRDKDVPGHLAFRSCRVCGCTVDWRSLTPHNRMGINARLFDPQVLAAARMRRLDGADTWTYLDEETP